MDPRIHEHARILVEHSTQVEAGDNVLIQASSTARELVVALHELLGARGANPVVLTQDFRAKRAFMRASDPNDFELPSHLMALAEAVDVIIAVSAAENTHETEDISPGKDTAYKKALQPFQEETLQKRWVSTQFPAPSNAQEAEMSTEAYEEFVYDAVLKDWDAQCEHQEQLVEILAPAETVRIVSGDGTDLTMSVAGMNVVNDYGQNNLPGGEVFTAPVPDSVEGEVLFDKPLMVQGREIEGASLQFDGGEVVSHGAEKNEDVLSAILDTDEGARRVGELGIGMNRDIERFTCNMLFDEKMGDTIHMALGRAIEETVPEDRPFNNSAVHMDMIVDMSTNSRIEVDGEVIQRNGTFVFEDGFKV